MALEKPGRYVALDGWRGICALMVAMFHLPVVGGYLTGNAVVQHAYLFVAQPGPNGSGIATNCRALPSVAWGGFGRFI